MRHFVVWSWYALTPPVSRAARTIYSHITNPFSMPVTPSGSKKKKARACTPASPSPAQAAQAERASKRASTKRDDSAGATMSSARVDDDIQIVEEGNKGVSQQHIEPNVIINLSGESGHVSSAGAESGSASDHSRSQSRRRQSEHSQSSPPVGMLATAVRRH